MMRKGGEKRYHKSKFCYHQGRGTRLRLFLPDDIDILLVHGQNKGRVVKYGAEMVKKKL